MDITLSEHGQSGTAFRVVPMPPDGSCLFHAIDYFANGRNSSDSSFYVRRRVVDYVLANWERLKVWTHDVTGDNFTTGNLILKVGAPIMLLRNLHPPKLCNGTRLIVKSLKNTVIEAVILTGCGKGESVLIPRIPLIPTDMPFQFKRIQFPVRVGFAMTVNKAQGQSLKQVGVNLREDCFSHGQFYVACSRVSCSESLTILQPEGRTANVVYKEVFRK